MTLQLTAVLSPPIRNVSQQFGPGLHVVIGQEADGTADLVALCAGVRLPLRGRVTLDGRTPASSPELRRRIASLLASEPLAAHGSLREHLTQVGRLRGFDAANALERFDPDLDLARGVSTLSAAERRAAALSLALAQPAPLLLVLHDPLGAAPPASLPRVEARITELAQSAVVVVTTAAVADARRLAGNLHVLERGQLVRSASQAWPEQLTPGLSVWLRVEANAPRELLAALLASPDVLEAHYDAERAPSRLTLRGADLERLALAVQRAALARGVELHLLQSATPDLEVVQGASAGLAHAAFRAAQVSRPSSGAVGGAPGGAVADLPEEPPP